MTRPARAAGLLALVLLAGGCASEESPEAKAPRASRSPSVPSTPSSSAMPSETPSETSTPRTGTVVIAADGEYGRMLFDATGQPIYLFDAETSSRSECYAECAEAWPPVLTDGLPRARDGVRTGLLGTARRADGSTQVTYAGHRLYFYAHEGKFEVLCHNVEEYGGTWLVVRPDGTPVTGS